MEKEPQPNEPEALTLTTKEWFALLDSFNDEPTLPPTLPNVILDR